MSDTIPPNTTAYEIPLTDRQLMHLGRITATWAQVEFFIDRLLMLALDMTPEAFDKAYSAVMVGTRLDNLDAACLAVDDANQRAALAAFVASALKVKRDRNHAVHGLWGLRVRRDQSYPAARHRKTPGTPLRAERLKRLEADIAEASLAGANAIGELIKGRYTYYRCHGRECPRTLAREDTKTPNYTRPFAGPSAVDEAALKVR